MIIESLTNNHVKEWMKLNLKKYRDETELFIIEGDHLIEEADKKNLIKEKITIDRNESADFYVTPEIMKKISNQKSISKTIAICYKIPRRNITNHILILDGIQDPGNLGTIIRSAVAFNLETIILSEDSVDLYNDKVIRASEGMIFHVNVIRTNIEHFIDQIQEEEYVVIGSQLKEGKNCKNLKAPSKIALVMGNEGNGIQEKILNKCDEYVSIPMNHNCESLNVGVATSILLYELFNNEKKEKKKL